MFINDLQQEKNILQTIQKSHLNKLYAPDNPSGILLCQKHDKKFRWLRRDLQNGRPVTSPLHKTETALAEKLAVNLYRIICIQYIQTILDSITNVLRYVQSGKQNELQEGSVLTGEPFKELLNNLRRRPHVPADFFDSHSPYRPLILSHLQREYSGIIDWYLGDFTHNTDHPERLLFPVKLGYNVRSKSEVIAADRLYEEGILFHYEEQLHFSDQDAYPDFYIPITVLEKYAWEHFGAMDNSNYLNRTRGKILTYLDHQMFPGINMITTYETKQNPLTEEQVDQQIRWLKNRYRLAFFDLPPDESFNMYELAAQVCLEQKEQET